MSYRPLTFALLLALTAACAPPHRIADAPEGHRLPSSVRVEVRDETGRLSVTRIPLETYVGIAILSEFAPATGAVDDVARMYELQAVISRTYAVAHTGRHAREGFDLCSTTHCQLYEPERVRVSRWGTAAREAAARTAGAILWYDSGPATAVYHADCGGRTSDAAHVWGGAALPYLKGIRDDGPAAAAHASWTFTAARDAVRRALNAGPATAVGARIDRIAVVERDAAGRARTVLLQGEHDRQVRGEDFRAAMTRAFGIRSVRSTRIDVRRQGESFVLEGTGFGHGVGLCQAGAFARVRAGSSAREVLEHYYPGARLMVAR
jgi:stage II sporulation protein D